MIDPADDLTGSTVELLRELIRNACVNDGTPDSGQEHRSVATLQRFFSGVDVESEVVEPHPGRASLVVRVRGTDPSAPSLLLAGHTDVVPVTDEWDQDPFAAEIIDDVIWGRGALDMLHLTAAYAAVTRLVATSGRHLRGDLVFAAVADEEAGGGLGARWLVENRPDLVTVDGVLSETGGVPLALDGSVRGVTVTVGEKGMAARRLVVRGSSRHASTPWGSSNAVVTAAEAVTRIVGHPNDAVIDDLWPHYVKALDISDALKAALTNVDTIDAALADLGDLAGLAHAVTHSTFSPDLIRGGDKLNIVPSSAEVDLDIRTLPGVSPADVDRHLVEALGTLAGQVTIEALSDAPASRSQQGTPLYRALADAVRGAYPDAEATPVIAPGGSDNRFFRRLGVPAYGFGLLSERWHHADFRRLIHSRNERIDIASVDLVVRALEGVVRQVLA
jgi:acetylornithine deacetylase/succinyl-diaminopimelate desuccinylase-like protein